MPRERLVAALGIEVVGDHEQVMSVEEKLPGERLTAAVPGGIGRVDPAGARRELRAVGAVDDRGRGRRATARSVDELEAAIGPEEEHRADVAAGLAAVLVVDGVDLAVVVRRSARGLNR